MSEARRQIPVRRCLVFGTLLPDEEAIQAQQTDSPVEKIELRPTAAPAANQDRAILQDQESSAPKSKQTCGRRSQLRQTPSPQRHDLLPLLETRLPESQSADDLAQRIAESHSALRPNV